MISTRNPPSPEHARARTTHTHTHTRTHAHTHTHTHACPQTYMHVMQTYTVTYAHILTITCTHTRGHTHTHIHTHTELQLQGHTGLFVSKCFDVYRVKCAMVRLVDADLSAERCAAGWQRGPRSAKADLPSTARHHQVHFCTNIVQR